MLSSLRIENFAIVKQLELDFAPEMTAFTGETGAGKSIMIDALMLALGGRADSSVIRIGEETCIVTAVFHVDNNTEPLEWLATHDISSDNGEIILRRILYRQGRSKSYINGQLMPLQQTKELSAMLVYIHGQHQHQRLMHHKTHRLHVDNYAKNQTLLNQVQRLFLACQQAEQQLVQLQNQHQNQADLALLVFQIDELNALNLQENEVKMLDQEHQQLHHATSFLQHTEQITALLSADNENIIQHLHHISQLISSLPKTNTHVNNAHELVVNAIIHCEEALDEIKCFTERVQQVNPERLNAVESRLSILYNAARKYHIDASQLLNLSKTLQEKWQLLQQTDERISLLQQHISVLTTDYYRVANLLSAARVEHAKLLAEEISTIIRELGMPHGYIDINISRLDKMHIHGVDKVEYQVCTNPGMALDVLGKIASGGELSRISLAIHMITAKQGSTPTLIFDEVDVGVGGATAALIGKLLRQLGERLQIFCVTHQPQVASSAQRHFVVSKQSDAKQTYSNIIAVNDLARINEIARMLGGLTITKQTRLNAQELLYQQGQP